jgi:HAAS
VSRQQPAGQDADQIVERYLADVAARLPGPARGYAGIVAELRSGLLDAADAYARAGACADLASQAAVSEFGDPGDVADSFRPELAAGQARRVAVALLLTGPLVGLLWIVTAWASHLGLPWQWSTSAPGLRAALPVAAVVTAVAAMLAIAATGRLSRWLPARPRTAPAAAAVAGFGAVGADSLGLALLAVQLAAVDGKVSPAPAAAAAVASLVRLLLARRAARRCLAASANLRRTGR